MPVTLADILSAQRTVSTTVSVGDDTLTVRWRPAALTGETEDLVDAVERTDADTAPDEDRARIYRKRNRVLRLVLTDLIAGWDLTDAKGKEAPVGPMLAKLPAEFLWTIFKALSNDAAPKEASEPASSGS